MIPAWYLRCAAVVWEVAQANPDLAALTVCIPGAGLQPLAAAAQGVTWGSDLPPVLLLHGTADTCALVSNATQFARALEEAGAQARAVSLHLPC